MKESNFVHDPIVRKILEAIDDIFNKGRLADKAIEFHLRSDKRLGSRDRKLLAEATYSMVRWWRRIYEASGGTWSDDLLATSFELQDLAQWLANWLKHSGKMFRGEMLPDVDPEFAARWEHTGENPASRESVADWFYQKGSNELPEQWSDWLHLLNEEAPVFLRANTLVTNADEVLRVLTEEGFEVEKIDETALVMKVRANLFRAKCFEQGYFEMQDLHSQKVARFLDVSPGQRVVDACAGAGGKTLHLAALMQNRGQIIALDVHDKKLLELKRRARRAKTSIVESRWIETTKVVKRLEGTADRVLLDVPCSGSGVFRRNPDAKWKLKSADCDELLRLQQDIFHRYSRMVKSGGRLVYSTCSIFPSENQDQVQTFLANHPEFKFEEEMILPPTPGDGFYAARLLKQ